MAIKQSEQIDPENEGYYHLISRCVRHAFLCGEDLQGGQNYDHHRQWIENRILEIGGSVNKKIIYSHHIVINKINHYHVLMLK